jgi:ABC-type transport system involved in multi-copper enzyme maturation permease subunit
MVNLKIVSYVGSKLAVLGALCLTQCAVLLGIVHGGAALTGPWLPMFLVLWLTALVGLGLGLVISASARTSEVAIAMLPLILLPMVILGGVMQPCHKMNAAGKALAQVIPSRWAFEGLLLMETAARPTWTALQAPVPPGKNPSPAATPSAAPEEEDMAQRFFPKDSDRTGKATASIVLAVMLILLIAANLAILRWRDVH